MTDTLEQHSEDALLPCPFCGKAATIEDGDTLYPTGEYWRIEFGIKHYIRHKDRQEGDKCVWGMHCPEVSGGCGAEITADTKHEAVSAWNRRATGLAACNEWQPIFTAPKAGLVDVMTANGRRYINCYWDSICAEYRTVENSGILIRLRSATYWMSPPSPPEET